MAVVLFSHNEETYHHMVDMFRTSNRVGIVQPTGTGKSFLFLKWIEDNPSDRFCIFSPSNEIFNQLQEYAQDSGCPEILENVLMITYQTLLKMPDLAVIALNPDKIILDEFHRTGAELWGPSLDRVLNTFPDVPVLGASATPVRYLDGAKDMATELFDRNLAVEMTLGEAVRRGILPTFKYIPVWYEEVGDAFLSRYVEKRVRDEDKEEEFRRLCRQLENSYGASMIFQKYMPADGKFIVFCSGQEHLQKMKEMFLKWLAGISPSIHSYISISAEKDKEQQLQAFRNDNAPDAIKLLFTIDRLNEGVHVKGIDGVIMLRPTESPIVYHQQMGRALASGSKSPLIFDMVNNYHNLSAYGDTASQNSFVRDYMEHGSNEDSEVIFRIYEAAISYNQITSRLDALFTVNNDELWEQQRQEVIAFKEKHGRLPKKSEPGGVWIDNQRKAFRKGKLSLEQQEALTSIGVFFYVFDERWEQQRQEVIAFKKKHGRLPKRGEPGYTWINSQKIKFWRGKLSPERQEALTSIGVDFANLDERWEQKRQEVIAFKKKHGRLPQNNEPGGVWIDNQRKAFSKGQLSPERQEALTSIGVFFYVFDERWEQQRQEVIAFKKKHGRLPKKNESGGVWLQMQRRAFKKGQLSLERQEALTSAGIVFSVQDERWEQQRQEVIAFKEKHGRLPKKSEPGYIWIKNQKKAFNKGRLSLERQEALTSAGVVFSVQDERWEQQRQEVIAFKEKHGRLPKHGEPGYTWINNQRTACTEGKLSPERREALTSIGVDLTNRDERWEQKRQKVIAFKEKHGRLPCQREPGWSWLNTQRKTFKKSKLSPERYALLIAIGVDFPNK